MVNGQGTGESWWKRRDLLAAAIAVVVLQTGYVATTRIWPVCDVVHDGVRYTVTRGSGRNNWIPFLGLLGFDFVMKVKDRAVLTKTNLASGDCVEERIEWLPHVYERYPFLR
jgi:hypothetical protein